MGTSSTVEQFTSKITGYASSLDTLDERAIGFAAQAMKSAIVAKIALDTHGAMRLKGVGKTGATVGVAYNVLGGPDAQALIRATGPLWLLVNDTSAHSITAKRQQTTAKGNKRRTGAHALRFDGRFASKVNNPGTRGKNSWSEGALIGEPLAMAAFAEVHGTALAKAFA